MINNFFSPYGMKIDIVTNYVIQIKSFLCPYTVTSQFANIPKFSFFSRNILIEIVAFTFVCYFILFIYHLFLEMNIPNFQNWKRSIFCFFYKLFALSYFTISEFGTVVLFAVFFPCVLSYQSLCNNESESVIAVRDFKKILSLKNILWHLFFSWANQSRNFWELLVDISDRLLLF